MPKTAITRTIHLFALFYILQNPACPGDEIQFNYWETASSYQWDFGDGNFSSVPHTAHIYDSIGNYSVTLTVANGCGNSSSYTAQILISETNVPLEGGFKWDEPQNPNYAACEDIPFSSWGGINYQWNFGDGNSSSLQNPVHQYDSAGTYLIIVIITNGCGNSDTVKKEIDIVGNCTFISENISSHNISVYPNPSDGKINVTISLPLNGGMKMEKLRIYSVLGDVVYYQQLIANNEQLTTNLPPGIYFIQLTNSEKTESIKLIIR